MVLLFMLLILIFMGSTSAYSKGVYQTGPDFIASYFQSSPQPTSLWLTPELKDAASQILGHRVRGIRVRYWKEEDKTAWIMEEIGKELPITIGVLVKGSRANAHIEQVKILAFRESRGWEVRYSAFTDQYQNAKITSDHNLDQHIDGITGATLSVRAVTKVAKLALFYHQQAILLDSNQVKTR
ncbi:MAG: FMN-binding protein [Porticoccus sp.]|nr:FMN-binding protein [Porticoccus sp.]